MPPLPCCAPPACVLCLCLPCCPCHLPVAPQPCKVPKRGRFRSDNYAAVLRLQKTQPKDRRAYNAPYRNPCRAVAQREDGKGSRAGIGRVHRREGHSRAEAAPMFSIYTLQYHFPIRFHCKTAFRTNRAVYARSVLKAVSDRTAYPFNFSYSLLSSARP